MEQNTRTAEQIIEALSRRGIVATYEHPGFIHIPLVNKAGLEVGTTNGPWGWDVTEDGYFVDGMTWDDLDNADAAGLVDRIEEQYKRWSEVYA